MRQRTTRGTEQNRHLRLSRQGMHRGATPQAGSGKEMLGIWELEGARLYLFL